MSVPPVPWDQRADESAKAYAAFCAYRDMGPERSISRVQKECRGTKRAQSLLLRWSGRYGWVERVNAFDAVERTRLSEMYADERVRERKRRIQSLSALRTRLEQALVVLLPTDAKWGEVSTGLSRINADLRTEHGDDPPQRVELGNKPGETFKTESAVKHEFDFDAFARAFRDATGSPASPDTGNGHGSNGGNGHGNGHGDGAPAGDGTE